MPEKKRKKPLCRQEKVFCDSQPTFPPCHRQTETFSSSCIPWFHHNRLVTYEPHIMIDCIKWSVLSFHSFSLCLLFFTYSGPSEPFSDMLWAEGGKEGPLQSTYSHSHSHLLTHKCRERMKTSQALSILVVRQCHCQLSLCTTLCAFITSDTYITVVS